VKHSWIILGLLLLLTASVAILIYLWTQVPMSVPLALLLWALVFGIFALVGGIAWLAGWLPRKKKSSNRWMPLNCGLGLNFNPTQSHSPTNPLSTKNIHNKGNRGGMCFQSLLLLLLIRLQSMHDGTRVLR
jgi:hypothetical protein